MQQQLVSDQLQININSFGAEVCSVKNNHGLEYIWQANPSVWARHAPVLFPIVGKLKNDHFVFNERILALGQHGFARDMDFDMIECTNNSCAFQLISNTETKIKFPFDFVFQIQYQLIENKLITNYKIINPSNTELFFSVGSHPGFNCPLLSSEKMEDYYLEFEKDTYSQTKLNNGLRTSAKTELNLKNQKLNLNKELFDNDALVFENNQINKISLCSSKSNHKITLECFNWPYFGIWLKKGSSGFICLEPWYGIADHEGVNGELVKKDGIIKLAPKQEFNCSFSLIFN